MCASYHTSLPHLVAFGQAPNDRRVGTNIPFDRLQNRCTATKVQLFLFGFAEENEVHAYYLSNDAAVLECIMKNCFLYGDEDQPNARRIKDVRDAVVLTGEPRQL